MHRGRDRGFACELRHRQVCVQCALGLCACVRVGVRVCGGGGCGSCSVPHLNLLTIRCLLGSLLSSVLSCSLVATKSAGEVLLLPFAGRRT